MFIAERHVAFRIDADHRDLFEHGMRQMSALKFADEGMRREMMQYLPRVETSFASVPGSVVVLHKDPGLILLRDLVEHQCGKLDPRHVAWVISSLHNIACYLEYAGLSHNAISADTYFVSPVAHSGALLGGWWYAAPIGRRLHAMPASTANAIPEHLFDAGTASVEIDLELIHALARELLGDERGIGFLGRPDIPPALFNAVRLPASGDAVAAYRHWQSVLTSSFGKRKFVELAVTSHDIYQED